MNIKITIDAPELAGAIESLAAALNGMNIPLPATAKQETKTALKTQKQEPEKNLASKTMYFVHEGSDEAIVVKKGESLDFLNNDIFDEITKAEYEERLKANEKPEKDEKEEQLISLEVVRGKLADFSAKGRENQVKVMDALSRFGVKKLTDVEPSDYKELLELVGLSV